MGELRTATILLGPALAAVRLNSCPRGWAARHQPGSRRQPRYRASRQRSQDDTSLGTGHEVNVSSYRGVVLLSDFVGCAGSSRSERQRPPWLDAADSSVRMNRSASDAHGGNRMRPLARAVSAAGKRQLPPVPYHPNGGPQCRGNQCPAAGGRSRVMAPTSVAAAIDVTAGSDVGQAIEYQIGKRVQ
jgi:hypothetical protein